MVSGAGIEEGVLVFYVREEFLGWWRLLEAGLERLPEAGAFGEIGKAAGVVEELSECDLVPRLRQLRQAFADRVV
jgi:hypothetical protein